MNLSLSYTIDDAINEIKTYIDSLHIVNHSGMYSYSWPNNANPAGAPSGYIETYDPLRNQLGFNGVAWDTDHETHLEESTRAMMSPIVKLGAKIIDDVLLGQLGPAIDSLRNRVSGMLNPQMVYISKLESDTTMEVIGELTSFDHWPRMQFYQGPIDGDGFYSVANIPRDSNHAYIQIYYQADSNTYGVVFMDTEPGGTTFGGGYLLVW